MLIILNDKIYVVDEQEYDRRLTDLVFIPKGQIGLYITKIAQIATWVRTHPVLDVKFDDLDGRI